jgi:hypothetical protein
VVEQLLRDCSWKKGDKSLASGYANLAFSAVVTTAAKRSKVFAATRQNVRYEHIFDEKRNLFSILLGN